MNGTILGIVDKKIVYQNNSTKPNRNIFVVGGPGSYKTQSVVITNLFNSLLVGAGVPLLAMNHGWHRR